MSRMGRPLKGKSNLSHDAKVRLDDEAYNRLIVYCERTGKEKATVLREGLREYLDNKEQEENRNV